MDLFKNYFSRETLAYVLLNTPYVPGRLNDFFATKGLTSTTALVEELPDNDVTADSASIPRGSPPKALSLETRKMHDFQTATYAWQGAVLADEVLNVRAAGSGAAEVIQTRVNEVMQKLRRQADAQHELLRMQCLLGTGSGIGTKPASATIDVSADATKLRQELFDDVLLTMESALAGIPFNTVRIFCSNTFWSALLDNKWLRDTYINNSAATVLRDSGLTEEIPIGRMVFERYRGAGSTVITSGSAIAIPEGVDGLFLQCFAPNDTLSSVGTGAMGSPYYPSSEIIPGDKGWEICMQSHPVMICTRKAALQEITLT